MTLTELGALPTSVLPVRAFADHLRLGSGFADDGAEDGLLESYLRAAISALEVRTGKVLLARRFGWSVTAWRGAAQGLPVAPVSAVESVTLVAADGSASLVEAGRYFLKPDAHRPVIAGAGGALPTIASGGRCDLVFEAGYAADWAGVPAALAQAVFLLAACFFEDRSGATRDGDLPFAVAALIEPYMVRRIGGAA